MIDKIGTCRNWRMPQDAWILRDLLLLLVACALITGCGSESEVQLEEYLDEIEYVAPLNSTVEVPFGQYSIPIVARPLSEPQSGPRIQWIRLKFDLYAVVAVADEAEIHQAWEHHRGSFRDQTISVCRAATLDDVVDLRLAAIKSRLTDLARSVFGKKRIRQLLCTNIITDAV
jgi:hypothetical protein